MFSLLKVKKDLFELNIESTDVKHKKEKSSKQRFRQLQCGPLFKPFENLEYADKVNAWRQAQ